MIVDLAAGEGASARDADGGGRGGRDVAVGVIGGTEATKSELVPSISAEAKRVKERMLVSSVPCLLHRTTCKLTPSQTPARLKKQPDTPPTTCSFIVPEW